MKKALRRLLLLLLVLLIASQFIPVERSNPPVEASIGAPPPVLSILRRACFDCHSNETRWPWYSAVSPISFLVAHDVNEAREHMNFSNWESLDASQREHHREEIWEEVEEEEMPLWFYIPLHSEAVLSEEDLRILKDWANN